MIRRLGSWLRALTRRPRFEAGMADELQFHIDACADDLMQSGMPPEEARRRARLAFGAVEVAKRDCRRAVGLRIADALAQDVRYALRPMRRSPVFTVTALATIAICLGSNLAIFAVVDSVLLRPLPFPDGERLVKVFNTYPQAGVPDDGVSLRTTTSGAGRSRSWPRCRSTTSGWRLSGRQAGQRASRSSGSRPSTSPRSASGRRGAGPLRKRRPHPVPMPS